MSYQVLALKYRPQTFNEVVGQRHVTTTLSNAITADRVAHAILFTGPRGTGKTTIARILAKAMNCETGPTVTPCNQCKMCKDIIDGHCTDVFEIDGASNNSVDQIRDLRENVTYMPASATYKIYIIDEVHMLSTAAFNALLKTLEEPPEHVMFIFATTEVHKIPATILSRCQRHDLGRLTMGQISNHLKQLGEKEGFKLASESLDIIAREADGSIRDSLSLFDRILSAAGQEDIGQDLVLNVLGVLDFKVMHELCEAVLKKDGITIINIIDAIDSSGQDLKKFFSSIIQQFRTLSILKQCGPDSQAISVTDTEKQYLNELTAQYPAGLFTDILQALLNDEPLIKFSSHTRFAIETALLKLLDINPGAQIDQIIHHLDKLSSMFRDQRPIRSSAKEDAGSAQKTIIRQEQELSHSPHPEQSQLERPVPQGPEPMQDMPQPQTRLPQKNWSGFLEKIQESFPFMVALLSKGNVTETADHVMVELNNCSSFDKKRLDSKKEGLIRACQEHLGKKLEVTILSQNNLLKTRDKKKTKMKTMQVILNHPLVIEAQKKFDGKIINY